MEVAGERVGVPRRVEVDGGGGVGVGLAAAWDGNELDLSLEAPVASLDALEEQDHNTARRHPPCAPHHLRPTLPVQQ